MAIDYVNALGGGAGFNTKEIVTALVEAERAGKKAIIDRKLADTEAQISGFASLVSKVSDLRLSAINLNDATDFNNHTLTNSQTSAFGASAGSTATAGTHSISVTAPAKAQTSSTLDASTSGPTVGFSSASQTINGGNAFDMTFTIGTNTQTTKTVSVSAPTPTGVVTAINEANMGITAQVVALDTSGSNYTIQLTGGTGVEQAFSISESVSELSFSIPSGFNAADADLTVNGIQYSRSSNTIDDIISGVTLNLASATSGTATLSVARDTAVAKSSIESFVGTYNDVTSQIDALVSSADSGPLRGNSIVRQINRDLQNIVLNTSSTPGTVVTRLGEMGISITKSGELEIDQTDLDTALANNYADIATIFSANTNNDSEIGEATRGIAGDLSKLIKDLTASTGYLSTQPTTLADRVSEYQQDLTDLETQLEMVQERYTKQFLTMQRLIDEMNTTKDSLKSSFENLPFNNRKD
ncbi:MAG: hypothetical protein CMF52_08490 [Legionellales bacterium]|nr:hypothetical protein [Legionellales bacterium]